jgi:hypothetical protein
MIVNPTFSIAAVFQGTVDRNTDFPLTSVTSGPVPCLLESRHRNEEGI